MRIVGGHKYYDRVTHGGHALFELLARWPSIGNNVTNCVRGQANWV
jgi:hypothetical protein